ncbi:DEKNAAC100732 [Brettanomyces naardenensis]|uniref:DEKNAAC100732 n=1 Tax=Brettanomyces naardenensis TaxID=13370 RepID=A0A448YG77_BRENA|nr:DEKNAAC100732 [Brettanomyces naardenensis]
MSSSGKSNSSRRETKILDILRFIGSSIWISLFDKSTDNLEKSSENENQYMIIDNDPKLSKFISVPKEYENLNCESFVAGIIEGILDISYFRCEVSAHTVPIEGSPNRTVYLINFDESVIKRELRLSKK